MDLPQLPVARTDEIMVIDVGDETLVYDLARHRAHSLNAVARLVWQLCDGRTTADHMAIAVAETTGAPVDADVVWYALRRLNGAQLLAGPLRPYPITPAVTRRDLIRRATAAGLGLMALPAIATIIAPSTLQAQATCLPAGAACSRSVGLRCCPGLTCRGLPIGADLGTCG